MPLRDPFTDISLVVDLRKVYFEAMLLGTDTAPVTIEKVSHIAPWELRSVINRLCILKMPQLDSNWVIARKTEQNLPLRYSTYENSGSSDQDDIYQNTDFDLVVYQAHILEQFLDLV